MARSQRRKDQELFRKRRPNLMKKGDELAQKTKAKVLILVYHNGIYYEYKSTDEEGWPPSAEEILNHSPQSSYYTPKDFVKLRGNSGELSILGFETERQGDKKQAIDQGKRVFTIPKPPLFSGYQTA